MKFATKCEQEWWEASFSELLTKNHEISDKAPIKEEHIEYKMILAMTAKDPQDRPSAKEVIQDYLPKWVE